MKILIYKRTHKGDPDQKGIFGNQDCMGRIRNWNYDAVIGIGGKTTFKGDEDIKYRINWIGLEPKRIKSKKKRGDYVVFSHFELFEEKGKEISTNYPKLYDYIYGSRKRFDMSSNLPQDIYEEVKKILDSVKDSSPSEYEVTDIDDLETETSSHTSRCSSCMGDVNIEITFEECNECKPCP